MEPSLDLQTAIVYCPRGENFFCVEPVSHIPNAINSSGMKLLDAGQAWEVYVKFSVSPFK